ncbi:MAG: LysM peptidoglycan-binding domain-containing protein [Rhodospirillaceae bacterium]|nr:LysM peptidoglycan-binding domain-containing protein [Rhodospirillaceae bacterium]
MPIRRTPGLLAAALMAVACTPTLVNFAPRVHVVQPGDTLFSIAWRHQLDVRQLVLWNELENPDLILVGQQLFLTPPESGGYRAANTGRTSAAPSASSGPTGSAQAGAPQRGTTPPSAVPPPVAPPAAPAESGGAGSPATPAPARQATIPPARQAAVPPAPPPPPPPPPGGPPPGQQPVRWARRRRVPGNPRRPAHRRRRPRGSRPFQCCRPRHGNGLYRGR